MTKRSIWFAVLAVCAVLFIQTAALAETGSAEGSGSSASGEPGSSASGESGSSESGQPGSSESGQPGSSESGQPGSSESGEPGSSESGQPGSSAEGVYGNTIHWQLGTDGVLTITPEGEQAKAVAMTSGRDRSAYDWSAYAGQIQKVVIGDGINSVGNYAFQAYASLKGIELGTDAATIGVSAFAECTALKTLDLTVGLTTVQQQAFQGCTGLTAATLGPSVTTIGANAFQNCTSMETITLGGSLGKLDATMLNGCAALKTVNLMGTEAAALALPNGTPFRNCASVQKLVISGPTASLGTYAFALNDKDGNPLNEKGASVKSGGTPLPTALAEADLSGIQFTGKTAAIPDGLFRGCTALSTVKLPEGQTNMTIGARVFRDCAALEAIELPAGVLSIGESAFYACPLKDIALPEGVTTLGASIFENCSSLASVSFPAGLNAIGASAFKDCVALSSVKLPRTTNTFTFGTEAFSGCQRLTSVSLHLIRNPKFTLPSAVFQGCSVLSSVSLPDVLTTVGESAFQDCKSLESITFPKNVTNIGKLAFSQCTALRRFEVQGSNVTLSEEAFSYCTSMTAAVIPEGVTTIGARAFQYCSALENAVIPSTAKTVSDQIFLKCDNLQHVYYPGSETEWNAVKDSDKLREYLTKNCANGEETLVLDWDKQVTPIIDGYETGGGGADAPVNPGDPDNAYGKNLPAKISGVSVSEGGVVTAKVLGTPGADAVLMAVSYSAGGEMLGFRSVSAPAAGTYTPTISMAEGDVKASYVYLFLLNGNAPVAEKYSVYLN